MSIAGRIAWAAGLLLLALVVVGVFLPSQARVQREAFIDAPAATVYVLSREPDRIREWSPWIGPGVDIEIDRDAGGRVQAMRWNNGRLGDGRLSFVEATPYERIDTEVETGGEGQRRSTLVLAGSGDGTRVEWTLAADFGIDLAGRYAGLLFESRAGETLERGLTELTTLAESLPRADWSDVGIERLVVEPVEIAYLTATSRPNADAISEAMGEAYFEILGFMDRHGLEDAGPPLSISRRFSGSQLVFDAAIPVRGVSTDTPRAEGGIRLGQTWGGPVVRGRHLGAYRNLADTHEKIAAYLAVHGISRAGDAWEVYVADPTRVPEERLVTDVYYPIEAPQERPMAASVSRPRAPKNSPEGSRKRGLSVRFGEESGDGGRFLSPERQPRLATVGVTDHLREQLDHQPGGPIGVVHGHLSHGRPDWPFPVQRGHTFHKSAQFAHELARRGGQVALVDTPQVVLVSRDQPLLRLAIAGHHGDGCHQSIDIAHFHSSVILVVRRLPRVATAKLRFGINYLL